MVHLTFPLPIQQLMLSTDAGYILSYVVFDYCALKILLVMLSMAYPRKSIHALNTNITKETEAEC
jgi:hypothetical protein